MVAISLIYLVLECLPLIFLQADVAHPGAQTLAAEIRQFIADRGEARHRVVGGGRLLQHAPQWADEFIDDVGTGLAVWAFDQSG